MEILRLLDEFENTIEECSRIPMTGKLIIHEDTLYSILDRIRAVLPESVNEAEWIMRERERIISEANREAETIIETAKSKLQRIAGESEVVKLAKLQSDEIIENSKNIAKEVTQGAFNYADDVMLQLQSELEKILQVVRKGREEIRQNLQKKG
ncbi:MAG: ATPase [Peptococcaceae bacterium]|jgi:vacuolar-type H+-ATPase subunit H|nr:ATPase [Peptococcaceae bacterium]MDH7525478.1 ATPase [Peptococcaceae bacterium]